jgi:TolA-binding protein
MKPDAATPKWECSQTQRLLDDARELREPEPGREARLWDRIARDTVRARPARAPLLAFATGLAAVALVFGLRREEPPPRADVQLVSSPSALYEELTAPTPGESPRQVVLWAGRLDAAVEKQPPGRQFAIITPHLRVVVVGTRFSVEVEGDWTRVTVQQGRVRVESVSQRLELGPGESVRSDDPRFAAAAPPAEARSTCEAVAEGPARLACYERLSRGEGLAAENALFLLGLAAERQRDPTAALERWKSLCDRFPDGVLVPEAQLASLRLLVGQRRTAEALEVATRFLSRHAADTRTPEVLLVRARLLCALPARRTEAVASLTTLHSLPAASSAVQQEALFALAACQRDSGDPAGAADSLRSYLQRFADGPHAAAARARLEDP